MVPRSDGDRCRGQETAQSQAARLAADRRRHPDRVPVASVCRRCHAGQPDGHFEQVHRRHKVHTPRLRSERLQGTALETLHLRRLLHVGETHQRGHMHGYLSPDPPAAVVRRTSQVSIADQGNRMAMRRSRRATAQDTAGVSERRDADVPHQSRQGMQVQAIRSVAEQHGHEVQHSAEQSAARTDATKTKAPTKEGKETTERRQETATTAHRIIDSVVLFRHWTNEYYRCCCFLCRRHVSPLKVGTRPAA